MDGAPDFQRLNDYLPEPVLRDRSLTLYNRNL
jgi:hypothetical protein